MADETYVIEYQGYEFELVGDPVGHATTTLAPNLRVIRGSWKTWHLDPGLAPGSAISIKRSVSPSDASIPHPAGNLTAAQSVTQGWAAVLDGEGNMSRAPIGMITYQRMAANTQTESA